MKLYPKKAKTRARAIRYFCYECMGSSRTKKSLEKTAINLVPGCTDEMCPLFEFRMGKNPYSKQKGPTRDIIEKGQQALLAIRQQHENQRTAGSVGPVRRGR
jgi:hypothetical protein